MRPLLLLAALALAPGCADPAPEAADVTVDGVDPVQSDGDLTPDATLQPDSTALAPEADITPEPDLEPDAVLQPDSLGTP